MATNQKTVDLELWKIAQQFPYKEHKFSTVVREFTPSFTKRQYPFIKDVIKRIRE
jgi:hypothetical protein